MPNGSFGTLNFNLLVRARSQELTKMDEWLERETLSYESAALADFSRKGEKQTDS